MKFQNPITIVLSLILVFLLCAVVYARKDEQTLTLTGSTTVLPISQYAAEEFMAIHPEVNISVRGGGSGVGIAALIDATADIANSSRPIKTKEITACREKGIEPVGTTVALDGIAIVVHPENAIQELTLEQVRKIYNGEITKWSELGGPVKPIMVVSRDVASGTFEVFKEKVLEGDKTRPDALMVASNQAVAASVAQSPDAIGYIGLGYLSKEVKALNIDGITPSNETVISGEYKIARPLYMYTNGEPKGLAKQFLDFILSEEGKALVEEVGFVPVN
ncbi:PstS family phosphate ABC transporter substrate-binding protein [bacterium]|nr:PstS family phosphate ABC transporter substrate-binding protein [bacterium]